MKTTAKDFKTFKDECQRWIDYFGLHGWDVEYTHDIGDNVMATFWHSLEGRSVTINLSLNVPDWLYNENNIKKAAFHEVVESMLLGGLALLADARYINKEEITASTHEIVGTLENTLFKGIKP